MELREVATIAGKPGLFKILKPSRNGVIVETLDAARQRQLAGPSAKVSILKEITLFTTEGEGSTPLETVLQSIYAQYKNQLPVSPRSEGAELHTFMKSVLPSYDTERVYTSDIKKLVTWYLILVEFEPSVLQATSPAEEAPAAEVTEEAAPAPKAKKAAKEEAAEVSAEAKEEAPAAAPKAKKSSKKAE